MTEPDDNLLIEEVVKGKPDALARLYDRHGRLAYGVAYRVLSDGPAAEEAVQDAFLTLWRKAHSFQPDRGAGVRAWLLTIVRNAAIDRVRLRQRRQGLELILDEEYPYLSQDDPVSDVLAELDRQAIREALRRLPDEQRTTIEMAYFGGLSHREIAEQLELPLGTVKGRMRLGLNKLHEHLLAYVEIELREPVGHAGESSPERWSASE